MINKIKLNIGASPIWHSKNWHILDHKLKETNNEIIAGEATNIKLKNSSCSIIFCSHVIEHIPHYNLPKAIAEMNRVLSKDGTIRVLTPDLEKICRAYVNKNEFFFKKAKQEDESIRTDLGLGGMLMNFIVSPGQDTVLLDRNLNKFIGGYGHLYNYDYHMLSKIFRICGFKCRKAKFNDSEIKELREPLHIEGLKPVWKSLNQKFYNKHGLIHKLIKGKYKINFTVTGFDRDPVTSLIIEAKKVKNVDKQKIDNYFNQSKNNYNRYSRSLLADKNFLKKIKQKKIKF